MSRKIQLRCVGIDVSAKSVHVAAEGHDDPVEFANTPAGFKMLLKHVSKGRFDRVDIVLEATGSYHIDLACFLASKPKCRVMVVNPRVAKAFHAAQGRRAKTDRVDARSLLGFAQRMEFKPWNPPSREVLELRAVSRYVEQLVKEQTRLRNQLEAATATETTADWVVEELGSRLVSTKEWVKEAKRKLVELFRANTDMREAMEVLDSMPGIAPSSACRLVAEFAFLDREMTGKQITAWAGLDPLPKESGTSVRGRRGMSKRGNARVRSILFMCSLAASRKGPFADLKQRVQLRSGQAMVGLGAVMRKMLVVAWAMFRTRTAWNSELASPRIHQSATVARLAA